MTEAEYAALGYGKELPLKCGHKTRLHKILKGKQAKDKLQNDCGQCRVTK